MSGWTRCVTQIVDPRGRRHRCTGDATTDRAGHPVCDEHKEPEKTK